MSASLSLDTYRPSPMQNVFHGDAAKYRLLLGAWRAGKSVALIWENILSALEYPGARFIIFRKTYPALRDTTWRDLLAECPPELIVDSYTSEGREQITLISGTTILGRCLDDWRKLGSSSFDLISVDEAYEISELEFDMLSKGRLSGKIGPRRMILATNPPNRDHWLYKRFVVDPQENMHVHHFATTDNVCHCDMDHPMPGELAGADQCNRSIDDVLQDGTIVHSNLPPGYVDELRKMPENRRRRFLEGLWGHTSEGQPVFTEFSESRHVANLKRYPQYPVYRGWDFGYYHPAVVWLQILPTGHVNVLHELMGSSEDIESFARRVQAETVREFPNYRTIDICDAAGVQKNDLGLSSVQVLRKFGLSPRFRKLRIWKTIEGMRELIRTFNAGVPLLRVDTSCTWTIEALASGYVINIKKDGAIVGNEELPKKDGTYDHIVDALRYALADIYMPATSNLADRRVQPIRRQRVAV